MYDFMWSDFCDWYIELVKPVLYSTDENKKNGALSVLVFVLENSLKLLHPFIPFITDEIYRNIPGTVGTIMTAEFPRYNSKLAYKKDALAFEGIMDIIKAVRAVKTELDCPPSKKVSLYITTDSKRLINANEDSILKLAGAKDIKYVSTAGEAGENTVTKVLAIGTIYIPMGELVDFEKEIARLEGELEKVTSEIARADGKLNNQGFMAKAPKKLVDEEKAKRNKYIEMREKIVNQINSMRKGM
jgi:valyl-tRNA synthetase